MSVIENALDKKSRAGTGIQEKIPSDLLGAGTAGATSATRLTRSPVESADRLKRIAIDRAQLRRAGYVPEQSEERRFADYYRAVKRPIIHKALAAESAPDQRLILVASSLPDEGKTFTTLNLAFSMAREHDISVLLVDADLPKAHISRVLGIQDYPGLIDALRGDTGDPESLVLRTDIPGLEVLPAGGSSDGATELIASARMTRVAGQLTQRNPRRLVLFDSSPVLVSSEARALVHVPGQILLVARSGRTPQRALLEALTLLDKKRLSGLVLNDAAAGITGSSYDSYGYYYADLKKRE
jgi:exopolysaccharide/PEP-CTERM locus tyrosine autokinase